VQLALVFLGVVLLLIAAAITVVYEDQRESRRRERQRRERLIRLGEIEAAPRAAWSERFPGHGLRRPPS